MRSIWIWSAVFLSTLSLRRATLVSISIVACVPCFLSTLSLRRATANLYSADKLIVAFYPRSPCGERLAWQNRYTHLGYFLSTLSLRRATDKGFLLFPCGWPFYPRSPCGERRKRQKPDLPIGGSFYPRSPCGERPHRLLQFCFLRTFYPRSPCGERQWVCDEVDLERGVVLSTLSLRRATRNFLPMPKAGFVVLSTLSLRRATAPRRVGGQQ